jgi:GT2 family glycosyltransferase
MLVRIDTNVGFARAMNQGAQALPGDAYLMVNNDAFVHRSGSLEKLVGELGRPRVGVVVPRLLNEDLSLQPSVAPFTGPLTAFVRASGVSRFLPNRWQPRLSTHWDHASSREVPAAIGPVILVGGKLWEALGGFRESAFMYAEDIDLCWRAREFGWRTWFARDSEFVHLEGASSDRRWSTKERAERVAFAEAEMIRRHLASPRATAAIAFMRLGLAARARFFGLVGNDEAAAACRGSLVGLSRSGPHERLPEATVEIVPPRTTGAKGARSALLGQQLADRGPGGPG